MKGRAIMNTKMEDLFNSVNDLLHKKEEKKSGNCILTILAVIGAVAAVAGIAYAVYRYFTPDYLEDFDDDFYDDFDDDDDDDDSCGCGCKTDAGDNATKVTDQPETETTTE